MASVISGQENLCPCKRVVWVRILALLNLMLQSREKTKEKTKKLNEVVGKQWKSEALGICSGTGRPVKEWL